MFSFSGRSILITGGTSGIGLAIARAFAASGAGVTVAGLGALPAAEPGIRFASLDVTDTAACNALVASLGRIDAVVNAAGIIRRDAEFSIDVFQRVMDVNLTGAMRIATAAKEKLAASNGAIVNIASLWSYFGSPRVPAYTASKGAIAQLTKSLAVAWAADGIRVNAVAPGWIATPLTQALQDNPELAAPILARCPLKRWGQPEEIAPLVLFLCSDAASFITGAVMPIDGGYSAM
ncbi:MAG: SDR family oxidoreductase [Acidobacteria bacterium]|nr:SDR family oxidoreductase [Acidobacteriota bacterium]